MVLALVVLMPIVALTISAGSPQLAETVSLTSGTGLVAAVLMVAIVVLVSRVRGLTRVLGVEVRVALHRRLGVAVVGITVTHVVSAVAHSHRGLGILNLFAVGPPIKVGIVAVVLMAVLVALRPRATSRRYGLSSRVHAALGVTTVLLVVAHVVLFGHLPENPLVGVTLGALGVVLVGVVVRRWIAVPLLDRGLHVVSAVRPESSDTSTVVLTPARRALDPAPEPGQFVWLRLRRLPLAEEHPFTIAASTRAGRLELTVRDRGPFSSGLQALEVGRHVWVDGPHGAFVPIADTDISGGGLVLIAGGVGITPIMSILRAHAAAADPRAHALLLAERENEALFATEILALSRRLDLSVLRTGGHRLDPGMLRAVLPTGVPESHRYFVCGPPPLVGAALDGLGSLGVPARAITTERFG
jgi:predicted ferric reductase